ncbi:hypothetical protein JCM5296_003564 [Sporobolomyces johnsonii]
MPSSSLSNYDQSPHSSSSTPHPPSKPPVTHFLALNLVTPSSRPQLLTSLAELKDAMEDIPDVSPRPVGTLHLTLGVMSLRTREEIEQAAEHLRSLDLLGMLNALPPSSSSPDSADAEPLPSTSASNGALTLTLASLVPMHKPSSTSVLYVDPRDPTSRLEPFCAALRASFTQAGHLLPETRPLKLHGTVVNTNSSASSRRGRGRGKGTGKCARGGGGGGRRHKFDATQLVERFRDKVWADGVEIDKVAICRMGAKPVRDKETGEVVDEVYEEVAVASLVP